MFSTIYDAQASDGLQIAETVYAGIAEIKEADIELSQIGEPSKWRECEGAADVVTLKHLKRKSHEGLYAGERIEKGGAVSDRSHPSVAHCQ